MGYQTILLADDDLDDREMFCEALSGIDAQLVCNCVINGAALLDRLDGSEELPDLIFLDLNMPVMNGWDCLKLLKGDGRYREIPVIMISTSSHGKEIAMAETLGAVGYFVKPSDFRVLQQVLQRIVAGVGGEFMLFGA